MIKLLLKSTVSFCLFVALGLMLSGCSNESLVDLQAEGEVRGQL